MSRWFAAWLFSIALLAATPFAKAEEKELLWPKGAPGAKGTRPADKPELFTYLPPKEKATGAGGGGLPWRRLYGGLAISYEGHDVAAWLNKNGIAGFVLKYRVSPYRHPAPLEDAQRAIRTVRSRAKELGIDPAKIGNSGFSAGGHLASTAATHFDEARATPKTPSTGQAAGRISPCWSIPSSPSPPSTRTAAPSATCWATKPDAKLVESLSNEKQVTNKTPPTFLAHTSEDTGVPPQNSVLFYLAAAKRACRRKCNIYEKGQHGLGFGHEEPCLRHLAAALRDMAEGREL